jgi:hypothetical protein
MRLSRHRWLPATVIGSGFGEKQSGAARDALVSVRRKRAVGVELVKASTVCYERGLYSLSDPPAGVDVNLVDHIFGTIEPVIPAVIAKLERGDRPSMTRSSFSTSWPCSRPGIRHISAKFSTRIRLG